MTRDDLVLILRQRPCPPGQEPAEPRGSEGPLDLCGADLRCANLRALDLCGARLQHADMRGTRLADACLKAADLRGADLGYADLRYADLRFTNLRGADLTDANLYGADLYGADLRGAELRRTNLVRAHLVAACGLVTIGPLGSRHDILYVVAHAETRMYSTGCFWGAEDEFVAAVKRDHEGDHHGDAYRAAVALAQLLLPGKGLERTSVDDQADPEVTT